MRHRILTHREWPASPLARGEWIEIRDLDHVFALHKVSPRTRGVD